MSQKILNGSFDSGTPPHIVDDWDNGVGGGSLFAWLEVSHRIRGSSNDDSISELIYKIRQQFTVNDEAIIAKISAWGQWQSVTGDVDGYNQFIMELKKPDMSMVELLNVTKTGLIGSGQLLDEVDIKSNFDQYGNYELWLTLKTRAKRDDENTSLTEPYADWTNGGDLFSLYESNNKIKKVSDDISSEQYIATMTKQFTIDGPAYSAPLTVQAKGSKEHEEATATAYVKVRRVGYAWNTIKSEEMTGDTWVNIINNEDISSYLASAGTYELRLEAKVKSYEQPEPLAYYTGEIHFGNVDFTANWYQYVQSHGHYDDISLEMSVKKYKTVTEAIGASGDLQGLASITKSEIIKMAESIKKFPKIKRFIESVGIAESYEAFAGKKAEVKEVLGILEAYIKKAKISKSESVAIAESYGILASHYVEIKEILQIIESYSKKVKISKTEAIGISESVLAIKQKLKNITESIKISESCMAKRTHGNLETTYTMGTPTEWDGVSPVTTPWITKKTEINQ